MLRPQEDGTFGVSAITWITSTALNHSNAIQP